MRPAVPASTPKSLVLPGGIWRRNFARRAPLQLSMRPLLVAVLVLLAGPPAASACERTPTGDRFASRLVERDLSGSRVQSAIVVCDHRTGRRRALRRAVIRGADTRRPRGSLIGEVAQVGPRLAWTESTASTDRLAVRVVVVDLVRRQVVRRWSEHGRIGYLSYPEVALTSQGDVAWTGIDRLRLSVGGHRPRVVARSAGALGFEDGTTLRWREGDEHLRYLDFRSPPTEGGCPRRGRFRVVASNAAAEVTRAGYTIAVPDEDPDLADDVTVLRACDRATGRDPVVATASVSYPSGTFVSPLALQDRWLLVVKGFTGKGTEGSASTLRTVDVRGERPGVSGSLSLSPSTEIAGPDDRRGIAITERGSPVWETGPDADRLVAITSAGELQRLDEGPLGAIAELRAQGTGVAWTNAGEPRSAEIP